VDEHVLQLSDMVLLRGLFNRPPGLPSKGRDHHPARQNALDSPGPLKPRDTFSDERRTKPRSGIVVRKRHNKTNCELSIDS
jgi:hypothetical protein